MLGDQHQARFLATAILLDLNLALRRQYLITGHFCCG